MQPDAHDFWAFAQATWAREGVARRCLELQDRHGANVMLLLYACWLAERGAEVDAAGLVRAGGRVELLDAHLVVPLRAARRALRSAARALACTSLAQAASTVHEAELAAERGEAALLAELAPQGHAVSGARTRAAAALEPCLSRCGIVEARARALAAELAGHAFPQP